jgi:hypothetical protein
MAEQRTTVSAEHHFQFGYRFIDSSTGRNHPDAQWMLFTSLGLQDLAKAIRDVYDKLEQIERKISTR